MVRGVDRLNIFIDDSDRRDLLRRLSDVFPDSGCTCFAWALMSNHFHLVVRTGSVPLGRMMARVGTGYVMRFNLRYGRVGHLVQNRFKSRLVGSNDDLLNLIRYVHLNPIRGRIVSSLTGLRRYPWSGHAGLMGDCPQPFHDATETLSFFGKDPTTARDQLSSFMYAGLKEAPPDTGEDTPRPRLQRLIHDVCRSRGIEPDELIQGCKDQATSAARSEIAYRAATELKISRAAIARTIGISSSAVSRCVQRARHRPGSV